MIFQASRIQLPIPSLKSSFASRKTREILKLMREIRYRGECIPLSIAGNTFKYPCSSFLGHIIEENEDARSYQPTRARGSHHSLTVVNFGHEVVFLSMLYEHME